MEPYDMAEIYLVDTDMVISKSRSCRKGSKHVL